MNILFLTKEEMTKASKSGKVKTNEQEQLDKIMMENGYRNGYGTRVMLDDIDPENDTRP